MVRYPHGRIREARGRSGGAERAARPASLGRGAPSAAGSALGSRPRRGADARPTAERASGGALRPPRVEIPSPGRARSFWLQEALAAEAAAPCPPLRSALSTDVCIVGGGFAGLWTAIELSAREP